MWRLAAAVLQILALALAFFIKNDQIQKALRDETDDEIKKS